MLLGSRAERDHPLATQSALTLDEDGRAGSWRSGPAPTSRTTPVSASPRQSARELATGHNILCEREVDAVDTFWEIAFNPALPPED